MNEKENYVLSKQRPFREKMHTWRFSDQKQLSYSQGVASRYRDFVSLRTRPREFGISKSDRRCRQFARQPSRHTLEGK